jgi:MoaA/NifB/PqqE/SkfB family radical SAM enzyme
MGFVGSYLRNWGGLLLGAEPMRPLLFSYYVTHRCELNCGYCSDGDGRPFKAEVVPELGTADAKRLISLLRGATDTLDITGGEPLLRVDLEALLAHAQSLGFRTVLNTKGLGLDERPDLLRLTDVLVLSVDALEAGRLAALIGSAAATAERILRVLHWTLAAGRSNGTRVVLSAVATPANLDDVAAVLRFALQNGLGFQVSPQIVGTHMHPGLRRNERYRRLIDEVLATKRRCPGVLGVPRYFVGIRDGSPFRCHPLLMPTIRPDGRMYYPCLERKRAEVDLLAAGNYFAALRAARSAFGGVPRCGDRCQIFCHMALSLLQAHPWAALRELKHWRN